MDQFLIFLSFQPRIPDVWNNRVLRGHPIGSITMERSHGSSARLKGTVRKDLLGDSPQLINDL